MTDQALGAAYDDLIVPNRLGDGHSAQRHIGVQPLDHAAVSFGPDATSGQYSQGPGTQRKTSPSTATWQTDGNDR